MTSPWVKYRQMKENLNIFLFLLSKTSWFRVDQVSMDLGENMCGTESQPKQMYFYFKDIIVKIGRYEQAFFLFTDISLTTHLKNWFRKSLSNVKDFRGLLNSCIGSTISVFFFFVQIVTYFGVPSIASLLVCFSFSSWIWFNSRLFLRIRIFQKMVYVRFFCFFQVLLLT